MAHVLVDFLRGVFPECPGVPEPLAELALIEAARDFCARTGYWEAMQTFTTVTDASGTGEYTLTVPDSNAVLHSVALPVTHNNEPVTLQNEAWLDTNWTGWRTETGAQAQHFTMASKRVVRLVPYPTVAQANALRVRKIFKPSPAAVNLDDLLYDDCFEWLADGTKARLMSMNDKDWSNPKEAARYAMRFEEHINTGQSMALAKWQSRRFDRDNRVRGHQF